MENNFVHEKFRYLEDLKIITDRMRNFAKAGQKVEYEIYFCRKDDVAWQTLMPRIGIINGFMKKAENIIQVYQPDALRVILYLAGKRNDNIIRVNPEVKIRLLDPQEVIKQVMNNPEPASPGISGVPIPAGQSLDGLGYMIEGIKKDAEIERLETKIEDLKEKNTEQKEKIKELEKENEELNDLVDELEKKGSTGAIQNLGATLLLGKIAGFGKEEIMDLAGLVLQSDGDDGQGGDGRGEKVAGLITDKKNADNDPRAHEIRMINLFLKSLSEEEYRKVISILKYCESSKDIESVYAFVDEKISKPEE